ncbi:MAG: HAD-IIA family hydrolase [Lachnospiraceae bacterium]
MDNKRLPKINADERGLLEKVRTFALDMDGTIYLDTTWLPGARDFLDRAERSGRRVYFLTNNSSKNETAYVEKLRKMGYPAEPCQIVTSGQAAIWYLQRHFPGKRVCLLGNHLLAEEFAAAGIPLDDKDPEVAVLAFDTELTYEKLCRFCDAVRAGLPYLATHPDLVCPTKTGSIPDAGSFIALVETATGRRPDKVIGKPETTITDYLLSRIEHDTGRTPARKEIAMVGDRLYTDVAAGVHAGFTSIFVLSGEGTMEDAKKSPEVPDLIYQSVADMPLTPLL